MQKTTFPFEIIVHDDASKDRTASIISEYQKAFPHIVKPIYEKENQYSKGSGIMNRIIDEQITGNMWLYARVMTIGQMKINCNCSLMQWKSIRKLISVLML